MTYVSPVAHLHGAPFPIDVEDHTAPAYDRAAEARRSLDLARQAADSAERALATVRHALAQREELIARLWVSIASAQADAVVCHHELVAELDPTYATTARDDSERATEAATTARGLVPGGEGDHVLG